MQNNLSAFLDRELSGEEMLAIRAHLSDCNACHEEEQAMRALKALLCGLPVPDPRPDLEERLMATVHRAERQASHHRMWIGSAVVFAVAAAGAMLGILNVIGGTASLQQQEARAQAQSAEAIPLEIRRDQAHVAIADPYGGDVEVTEAAYGR